MSDVMFNGLIKYDANFFTKPCPQCNEETVQPRDLEMMGLLLPLGIEKGKEFKPDAATVALLNSAAKEALRLVAWTRRRPTSLRGGRRASGASRPRPLPCRPDSSGRYRTILT